KMYSNIDIIGGKIGMVFIGRPSIEKRLARYPQLFSRIGFTHEFDNLSKDENHNILKYKWEELGLSIKLEYFFDYGGISIMVKIISGSIMLILRLCMQIELIIKINNLEISSAEGGEDA